MAEQLFQTQSYLSEFEATVTHADGYGVVLDRTAFYPGGGGQPCDEGVLTVGGDRYGVTKVSRIEGDVLHELGRPAPGPCTHVNGALDWERAATPSCGRTQRCTSYAASSGATSTSRYPAAP